MCSPLLRERDKFIAPLNRLIAMSQSTFFAAKVVLFHKSSQAQKYLWKTKNSGLTPETAQRNVASGRCSLRDLECRQMRRMGLTLCSSVRKLELAGRNQSPVGVVGSKI